VRTLTTWSRGSPPLKETTSLPPFGRRGDWSSRPISLSGKAFRLVHRNPYRVVRLIVYHAGLTAMCGSPIRHSHRGVMPLFGFPTFRYSLIHMPRVFIPMLPWDCSSAYQLSISVLIAQIAQIDCMHRCWSCPYRDSSDPPPKGSSTLSDLHSWLRPNFGPNPASFLNRTGPVWSNRPYCALALSLLLGSRMCYSHSECCHPEREGSHRVPLRGLSSHKAP